MKSKENYILITYLSSFFTFFILIFLYIPRPRLYNLVPILNNPDKLILSKNSIDSSLSKRIKRQITIGNSYLVLFNETDSLKLTPISFLSEENFDLPYYADYLPELIIDVDQIIPVKSNNYGVEKSISKNKYQSCLFSIKDPVFAYEFEEDKISYRYNDYDHWFYLLKKEIWGILQNKRKENINCLLVTTNNPEIFKKEKDLIKLISNNFIYE